MVIEAIYDNELKGENYKVGDQKNVTNSYGKFLCEVNGNWKPAGVKIDKESKAFVQSQSEEKPKTKKK